MKKIFTFLIVILPIITVYKSPINGLDLGTFLFIIISFYILFNSGGKILKIRPFILLLIYIALSTLISILLQGNLGNIMILTRFGKFVLLIFLILFTGYKKLFDVQFGFKMLKIVTILAVIYIIAQTIMYKFFGILLPNGIMNLVTFDEYAKLDYGSIARNFYRPSSFFIEPSSFVQYTVLYLCYCVYGWDSKNLVHNLKQALLISLGIILSGSGLGFLLVAFIWAIWLLKRLVITKLKLKKLLQLMVVLIISTYTIRFSLQTEFVSKTLARVLTDNVTGGGNAVLGRIVGYSYFYMLPNTFKFIGMGYGNVLPEVYFNGASYILYCCGILGAIIVLYILWDAYRIGRGFQRIFVVVLFILILGADAFTAASICFYFPFIYTSKLKNIANIEEKKSNTLTY